MKKKKRSKLLYILLVLAAAAVYLLTEAPSAEGKTQGDTTLTEYYISVGTIPRESAEVAFSPETLPAFSQTAYTEVNGNIPYFTLGDLSEESYEVYSPLDALGRCGTALANIGQDLMPTEERGDIGQVKPTGWVTVKYDFVDGKYLYNRCHLIGFQLTGENANEKNLITGTRYMNVQGMLPFENMVADYIKETGNHVLYRVTPVFEGEDPVAAGVLMEAVSVEDMGEGILFCVWCYNVQPGVEIDYSTGESREIEDTSGEVNTYVLNTGSMKFHLPDCSGVGSISEKNRQEYTGTRERLILSGYSPCGTCDP